MITLQQLRYFMMTAKTKSFSKASEILFISQPALSKQITNLEQSLQFMLFERTTKGICLTEKGRQFYSRIEPLIQDLDQVLDDLVLPEEIKIGVLPSISSYYIPKLIHALNQHNFKLLVEHTSAELLELVQTGFLDSAIVQDIEKSKNLKHLLLFEEPYLVVVSRTHRLAKKEFLEMSDLHHENIILPKGPCDIRNTLEAAFIEYRIEPIVKMEVPLNESMLSYSANNLGISFIPEMVAANLSMKNIVYKKIKNEPLKRSLHFFARSTAVFDLFQRIITTEECFSQIQVIGS
jgi:DNA-binding transcriptional LysR family regulator